METEMTTFKNMITEYLIENGMFDHQATEVFEAIKADKASESMLNRWNDYVGNYPDSMKAVIILSARSEAVKWIDKNCPKAWYRPMLAD